jgi:hypothetical protein
MEHSKIVMFPKLIIWNHLGRAASLNVLGARPPENQRLTTKISSRGRHTHGEEMYREGQVTLTQV